MRNYNINDTLFYVSEEIVFYDCSLNATQYYWDFGDGSTSTAEYPMHTYSAAGEYTVTHEVYSKDGTSDLRSTKITVNPFIPSQVRITNLIVKDFPEFDSWGTLWDSQWDGPDILVEINNQNSGGNVFGSSVNYDCEPNINIFYTINTLITIQEHSFDFYDLDYPTYKPMGRVSFSPMDYLNNLPSSITLNENGFSITIEMEWVK